MFENDDTLLETVLARYKLGLDHLEARQFILPASIHPGWFDRFLFSLGNILIKIGSRLQQRYSHTPPAVYHPAYPAS
jgi:hypothetical protein